MTYESPFDKLAASIDNWDGARNFLDYSGTVSQITEELGRNPLETTEDYAMLALHPARILRAAIDYNLSHFNENHLGLVRKTQELAGELMKNPKETREKIKQFEKYLTSKGLDEILDKNIHQIADRPTWLSYHPDLTRQNLEYLENDDVLLIYLAHGASPIALDIALRRDAPTTIYPVRFSTKKYKDQVPKINGDEIDYLREESDGRRIVLFDDDRDTNKTITEARRYFAEIVFPGQYVDWTTNLNVN